MPPMSSPTRRVLGEKDRNASLSITSPHKTAQTGIDSKRTPSSTPQPRILIERNESLLRSPRAGQKRSIAEVDGVDAHDWDAGSKVSRLVETVSDSASEGDRAETLMASTATSRTLVNASMTSFYASQEGTLPMDQTFELPQEEMSQRTLEKIHAVPLPQNTSQPIALGTRPILTSGGSQDSVGMSRFVDFDSDGSQKSDGLQMIEGKVRTLDQNADIDPALQHEPVQSIEQRKELSAEEQRRCMLEEKAAQLRTRLQLAYFKVQTNQTTRPLSRLKVPESMRRPISPPQDLPQYSKSARTNANMEAHVSAFRARATAQHKPQVRSLNSLPVPSIQPTGFSARYTTSSGTHSDPHGARETNDTVHIPSSPPVSRRSISAEVIVEQDERGNTHDTDVRLPLKTPTVFQGNEQLSSPPPSQGEEEEDEDTERTPRQSDIQKDRLAGMEQDSRRVPISVVKGEAADGLLQLMRGVGGGRGMCGV